jgi:hypothetical protein
MKGKFFTFIGALMECRCGAEKVYALYMKSGSTPIEQMEMMDKLKEQIQKRKEKTMLKRMSRLWTNGYPRSQGRSRETSSEMTRVIGESRALTVTAKVRKHE